MKRQYVVDIQDESLSSKEKEEWKRVCKNYDVEFYGQNTFRQMDTEDIADLSPMLYEQLRDKGIKEFLLLYWW
jgi:hypothetical protein